MYTPTIQIMNKERFEYIIKKTKINPCNQYKNIITDISVNSPKSKNKSIKINN